MSRRKFKVVGIALGLTVFIVGFVLMAGGYDVIVAARGLDTALARVHAAGVPASAIAMARRPIPEAENAAVPFKLVIVAATGKDASRFALLGGDRSKDPVAYDRARSQIEPVIETLRAGARRPHCDFGVDWHAFPSVSAPRVVGLVAVSKALCNDAIERSKRGDTAGAISQIDTVATVADRIGEEPFLIVAMVQSVMRDRALDAVRSVLERPGLDSKNLASIRQVLLKLGPPDWRRSLGVEALYAIEFANPKTSQPDPILDGGPGRSARMVAKIPLFAHAFQSEAAAHWAVLFEALPKDPNDLRAVLAAMRAGDRDMTRRTGFPDELLKASLSHFADQYLGIAGIEVRRRLLIAAVDRVLQPKARLPKDPFGPGLIIAARIGGRERLYSIGENGVDEAGGGDDIAIDLPSA